MIYEIDLLSEEQLKYIIEIFDLSDFKSGMLSANQLEMELKNNKELSGFERNKLTEYVVNILNKSTDFVEITVAKNYSGILFSKYENDMYYNLHNDDYIMGNGSRTDFSSTIFLNSPEEYEGGELILTLGNQELSYKLEAGKCLIYPTGLLHRVSPVKSGTRKVCVFWTESCISDAEIRMMLADFYFMWSKYYEEMYEKLGHEFCVKIQNIKMKLMRKYGNFSGVTIK
jgi:PKHD-type hydroxylase